MHLANADGGRLRNAFDLSLEYAPSVDEVEGEYSDFPVLAYVANSVTNEFSSLSNSASNESVISLNINEMFNFGATRMCFAVALLAKRGLSLINAPLTDDPNAIATALRSLSQNVYTSSLIDGICRSTIPDRGDNNKAWDLLQPYADRYAALHRLAATMSTLAIKEIGEPNVPVSMFASAGSNLTLGVISKVMADNIEFEISKEKMLNTADQILADN